MKGDFFTFDAGKIVGNDLYFSSNYLNGLYKKDIRTGEVQFLGCFPKEKVGKDHLHKACYLWNDYLIFMPESSFHLHMWNINKMQFDTVDLDRYSDHYAFGDGCVVDDSVIIFPAVLEQPLLRIF